MFQFSCRSAFVSTFRLSNRMKTTQQDLESLNKAIEMAQNCPLWRLMSMFGTTHS